MLFLFFAFGIDAQNIKDSTYQITEIKVNGYPGGINLLRSAASVAIVDSIALKNQAGFSFLPALNRLAGVRMEERSPGSYRLAIRGNLLRSPFGVRNVKVYLDEIPLTDAGGNTYLNLLDMNAAKRIEILKGPHGSLYGANTGGVLILNTLKEDSTKLKLNGGISVGSFGLLHEYVNFEKKVGNHQLRLLQSFQKSDGYRENSALQRHYWQINDVFQYHRLLKLKFLGFFADLQYQTPGGLTLAQYEQNPASARPSTATMKGAVAQRAAIENRTFFGGITHEAQFHPNFKHVIVLFGSKTAFKNPAIANYELRDENTIGLRTYIDWSHEIPDKTINWNWRTGLEWQRTNAFIQNFGNNAGNKDTIQSADLIDAQQQLYFTQFTFKSQRLSVELGLSANLPQFQYNSILSPSPMESIKFKPQLLPRLAFSLGLTHQLYWRSSVSRGFSAPTVAELKPSGTATNRTLQPENGWNYESGFRFQNSIIKMDAVVFYYQLQQAIVRKLNENGTEFFQNAGTTHQPGFEWQFDYTLIKNRPNHFAQTLTLSQSLTYYHFTFGKYASPTASYDGKFLPGVPQWMVNLGAKASFRYNFSLYLQYGYNSAIYLNNENTAKANDFHLLQLKATKKIAISRQFNCEIVAGIDNIANQKYSLGNDLNAFGNRFYNAAPSRNFYIGLGFNL